MVCLRIFNSFGLVSDSNFIDIQCRTELLISVKTLKKNLKFGKRFKMVLTIYIIIASLTMLSLAVLSGFSRAFILYYNVALLVFLLSQVVFIFISGTRYIQLVKTAMHCSALSKEMSEGYRNYLNRVFTLAFPYLLRLLGAYF